MGGLSLLTHPYQVLIVESLAGPIFALGWSAGVAYSRCVAVLLQCVAVRPILLQCVAVCCSMLKCVAMCCGVLQCVAVQCSVRVPSLVSVGLQVWPIPGACVVNLFQCVAVCCSALQCLAV